MIWLFQPFLENIHLCVANLRAEALQNLTHVCDHPTVVGDLMFMISFLNLQALGALSFGKLIPLPVCFSMLIKLFIKCAVSDFVHVTYLNEVVSKNQF